jgi:hypothetical protein
VGVSTLRQQSITSIIDFKIAMSESAANLLILEPEIQKAVAAERIIREAEPEFLSQLTQHLLSQFALTVVGAEKAKVAKASQPAQLVLPGFERIPRKITIGDGQKIALSEAKQSDLRKYLKALNQKDRNRHTTNPKIAEVKALIEVMGRHSRKHRGITYAEVVELESRRRGLQK